MDCMVMIIVFMFVAMMIIVVVVIMGVFHYLVCVFMFVFTYNQFRVGMGVVAIVMPVGVNMGYLLVNMFAVSRVTCHLPILQNCSGLKRARAAGVVAARPGMMGRENPFSLHPLSPSRFPTFSRHGGDSVDDYRLMVPRSKYK